MVAGNPQSHAQVLEPNPQCHTQVHAPSLGCAGMIAPGRPVLMTEKGSAKTSHALQLAYEVREGQAQDSVIGCHPQTAELIALQMLEQRCVLRVFACYHIHAILCEPLLSQHRTAGAHACAAIHPACLQPSWHSCVCCLLLGHRQRRACMLAGCCQRSWVRTRG